MFQRVFIIIAALAFALLHISVSYQRDHSVEDAQLDQTVDNGTQELVRYLWEDAVDSNQRSSDLDVAPYVGDAWIGDEQLMMARN
ncbi:MAG: hypothetical protein JJ956_12890, partial [Pseudomonadales bacterium]|nr:hypothetical protein [Pseudomonadales bacterium]